MGKIISCPVSVGEIFDKVSILQIKKEKISDFLKLKNIEKELELLTKKLEQFEGHEKGDFLSQLKGVNLQLWNIEDKLRKKELEKDFGSTFIEMARNVYLLNDQRFSIKNEINNYFKSYVREVKSY
jgi:hypothetical protein